MPRTVDPNSFGFLVTDLARLIRAEFDRRIADAGIGLTAAEARTLSHAARAGAVRQNVLAERMGVEAMTLSSFLDRLEANGLIVRVPDPSDRRAKLVDLTPKADGVLVKVRAIAGAVRDDAAASMDPAVWSALIDGVKAARTNLAAARDTAISGSRAA
jgi:MarR family transcriptional regulator for hemolysin